MSFLALGFIGFIQTCWPASTVSMMGRSAFPYWKRKASISKAMTTPNTNAAYSSC